jgi:hypothetical protein
MFTELKKIPLLSILQFAIFILQLLLFSCNCSKSTTDPPPPPAGPDTTSHNFIWQIDTIGLYSSYLLDVAIVDENNIWAVGEIHTAETDTFDSLGNWIPPYNAVRWDGQEWELKRILYQGGFWSIRSIFAFSLNDIWFDAIVKWNGVNFIEMPIPGILIGHSISKMWGKSANDLYVVGTQGLIAHYTGSSWQKLESGTNIDIQDIWGAMNPQSGEYEILAASSLQNYGRDLELLGIEGTTVSKLDTSGLHVNQSSLWFLPGQIYYITGNGVFTKQKLSEPDWLLDATHPLFYKDAIRGSDWNNVFIVGSFGLVSHYNGSTWRHYAGSELPSLNGLWNSVCVKNNCVVAVGELVGNQGIILRGRRN